MTLHTFGDSHSCHPWEEMKHILNIPNFNHHLGSITCSFFGFQKLDLFNIKKFKVIDGDIVCFVLGEIDCRCHIYKYKEQYKEIIDKIIENYFCVIKCNVEQFNNLITIILSVVPPITKIKYGINPDFPVLGEDNERIMYTQYMNLKIKEKCKEYSYLFLDVYDKYCDNQGLLELSLSDGYTHITNPKYMYEELVQLLKL